MMMTFSATAAAELLVDRRIHGTQGEPLPEHCRPVDMEQALAIQAAVTHLWCSLKDDSIGGWKCLLPVLHDNQEDKLILGPIYTRTIDSVPPVALWPKKDAGPKGDLARIEPELAFFFGQDLPPRDEPYTPAEVDAAISRTHMALELINSRFADTGSIGFYESLADGLVNQGLFIGPQIDSKLATKASEIAISVSHGGETTQHAGKHPNGNPRAGIYWLAEFLRSRGQGIVAGQAVITGSYAGVLEVPLGRDITIDYAGLGQMQVSFTARTSY
jgi:2-keto-4-pentenoate hydratase